MPDSKAPKGSTPHSSWAQQYDTVYELTFGAFYQEFTGRTVELIKRVMPPPATIVDFGAGTGRLAIPLALAGYQVTAVDPCREMLAELSRKEGGALVETFPEAMATFIPEERCDVAVCVFSVISYLLDEAALDASFRAAARAIRPGGWLLIDVPKPQLFRSHPMRTGRIHREVTISPMGSGVYRYQEETSFPDDPARPPCIDDFLIRHWDRATVVAVLNQNGFTLVEDLSERFADTGAEYLLMRNRGDAKSQ